MEKGKLKGAKCKTNDIFKTSWGYDQTQYDFLKVISVSKTGKTVRCKMIEPIFKGNEDHHDKYSADKTCKEYEPSFQMKVKVYSQSMWLGDEYGLRGSYPYMASLGSSAKRIDTFSPVIEGKNYHQTDAYSGH